MTAPSYNSIPNDPSAYSTSTKNPNDVWGLGALYGQPIALGTENVHEVKVDPNTGRPLPGAVGQRMVTTDASGHPVTTDSMMSSLNKMWAAQSEERAQDPSALTGYEQQQQLLWQAGYYGQTSFDKIHLGQWDSATQDAMKKALGDYEHAISPKGGSQPITWSEFMSNQAAASQNAPGGFYGPKAPAAVKPLDLANTTDLVATVQKAAEDALGHVLTKDQAERFATRFHSEQMAQYANAQQQANSPQTTGSVNPMEQPPSVRTEATQYAVNQDPQGYQSQQIDAYTNAFLNLFLPSSSGRANMAVDPVAGAVAEEPSPATTPPNAAQHNGTGA